MSRIVGETRCGTLSTRLQVRVLLGVLTVNAKTGEPPPRLSRLRPTSTQLSSRSPHPFTEAIGRLNSPKSPRPPYVSSHPLRRSYNSPHPSASIGDAARVVIGRMLEFPSCFFLTNDAGFLGRAAERGRGWTARQARLSSAAEAWRNGRPRLRAIVVGSRAYANASNVGFSAPYRLR